MISTASLLALVALLIVPGPTNALLLATGASGDRQAILRAPIAELAGYLSAVVLIGVLIGPVVMQFPLLSSALRLLIGVYLMVSAYRMWCAAGIGRIAAAPSSFTLLCTTLLNPKAIIIALVLMPEHWGLVPLDALPALAAVAACILAVSCLWLGLGILLRHSLTKMGADRSVSRLSALILAGVGVSLMVATLTR